MPLLAKKNLPAFLFACHLLGTSGVLTFRQRFNYKSLHFAEGWVRSTASNVESDWLGKILLAHGRITAPQLNEVERARAKTHHHIGEELITRGYLDRQGLKEALIVQYTQVWMSLFEWESAQISLVHGMPNAGPQLTLHPFRLIEAGIKFGFRQSEIEDGLPPAGKSLQAADWVGDKLAEVVLVEEEEKLLRLLDGRRTWPEIIAASPVGPESAKLFLFTLHSMRGIEEV